MRVRVLYFAGVRDITGVAEEERDLPATVATVADFSAFVARAFPDIGERMATIRVARNEVFAAPSDAIAEGDVLALIPPVAGG